MQLGASPAPPDPEHEQAAIIGRNLIVARYASNMSQQDLAEASGLSRATIAKLETGRTDPRMSTLVTIAKTLEIPLQLLLATPEMVENYVTILDNCHAIIDISPEGKDERRLTQNYEIKSAATVRKASKYAMLYAMRLGHATVPSRVGAAIFNTFWPGIGAAIGAYCFDPTSKPEDTPM